jgi:3-hydroxyacyl-CoA dehydrogenase
MKSVMSLRVTQGVGVIAIDSPPVNALGMLVRSSLIAGLRDLSTDERVQAIVVHCAGRTFFAGADIAEFGHAPRSPDLREVLAQFDSAQKPLIAAIHGTALGGGLETALVCHYRIAVPSARLGLPEVNLGLLPGAGGTQRLPRLVEIDIALDMMFSGKPISAQRALEIGLIDEIAPEDDLLAAAIGFARRVIAERREFIRTRERAPKLAAIEKNPQFFADFRQREARAFRGFKAPENIVRAVEAAAQLPFDAGLRRERELFEELLSSTESAAQRYAFFAERETAKVPGLAADTPLQEIRRIGVVGAGTMGGGIAMNFLNAGIPVQIVEANAAALERGVGVIRRNYEQSAQKGRISNADVEKRMALLTPSLDLSSLKHADLVIEAIFESMAVKKEVFAQLDAIAKPSAILASNTSYLDINEIAASTQRPQQVLGLHFFSPANVMRLLEIVRARKTSDSALATALKLAKTIGKVPVVAGVCHGFIANRAMTTRIAQANALALEGTPIEAIDTVTVNYGFPMGVFQMLDLVGLDVIGRDSSERTAAKDLVAMGRLGQKQNSGFYDYDAERKSKPSPLAARVLADVAAAKGIAPRPTNDPRVILQRLLYPVVNEGAKILDEGIAARAADVDVAAMLGYGWPVYTGGPMFWANTLGLAQVVQDMRALAAQHGTTFAPAPLLERLAAAGQKFQ